MMKRRINLYLSVTMLAFMFTSSGLATAKMILPGVAVLISRPTVSVLQPAPNTHDAPITTSLRVGFAKSIDPTSVSRHTIAIYSTQRGLVTGTYSISNTQALVTPTYPFFPGELIQGTVTTGIKAMTGATLVVPAVWQFRTATGIGSGTFVTRQSGLDSTWSEDISVGDLDGDSDLDIFLGHRDDASTVWFNDGLGHFSTNGIDLGTDFLIDVPLGDLDGDGDLDAILAGIQENSFWQNDGRGTFSYGGEVFAGSPTIMEVALGDLDGDGDLDAINAISCLSFVCDDYVHRIWLNDGTGRFQFSTQSLGNGDAADIALGDLEGDGDLDLVIVGNRMNPPAQQSAVWSNLGGGVFTSTQTLTDLFATSVDLGDLDNDGDLDAFVTPQVYSTKVNSAVWLNDGNGTFAPGQFLGSLGPATLGDIDGDGDLDAYSFNDGADKVWLNQGNATFVFSGQNLGMEQNTGVELGDLDGDGDLDAITSGYNAKPRLWLNQE